MKQRTVPGAISFAAITLLLVAGATRAQLVDLTNTTSETASGNSANSSAGTASVPAALTTPGQNYSSGGINDSAASTNNSSAVQATPTTTVSIPVTASIPVAASREGLAVQGSGSGVGGDGVANSGGSQVQYINVSTATNQEASAKTSEVVRRERTRLEVENEARLLERVEQGRLEDERSRTQQIDSFRPSLATRNAELASENARLDSAPVQAPIAAPIVVNQPVLVEESTVKPSQSNSSAVSFRVAPFAGYRWYANKNMEIDPENRGFAGIGIEGVLNEFLGIEGQFSYSRDEFKIGRVFGAYDPFTYRGFGYRGTASFVPQEIVKTRDSYEVAGNIKIGPQVSTLRPYAVGGISGITNRYDIDNQFTKDMLEAAGLSRTKNHVAANVGAGMDFLVNKNFAVGVRYEYQRFFNRDSDDPMHRIWGDATNRHKASGSLQIIF